MKKLITGVLATLACFACLTGCQLLDPMGSVGGNNSTSDDSSIVTPVSKVDLNGAKAYADDKFRSSNTSTRKDYELPNTLSYDGVSYPLSWAVNVTTGVTLDKQADKTVVKVDGALSEELQYKLTLTIADPTDASKTVSIEFNRTIEAAPSKVPAKITKAPVVGTAYKLYIYRASDSAELYMNGKTKSNQPWYFATTDDMEEAIDVFVEAVEGEEGKFYLYHNGLEGNTKTYINAYKTYDNHISNFFETEADMAAEGYKGAGKTKWNYDEELGTMVTVINNVEGVDTKYYPGSEGTYGSISPQCAADSNSSKGFLIEMVDRTTVTADAKVEKTMEELAINTPVFVGAGEFELAKVGATYPDVSVTWAVTGDAATIVESKLNIATAPTAKAEVTLTATIALEGATSLTKEFKMTLIPNETAAILEAANSLKTGESFANESTLTGIVKGYYASGNDTGEYNTTHNNVSVYMLVKNGETYTEMICYRMGGAEASKVTPGDTITVTGVMTRWYDDIQYGQGCKVTAVTDGTEADIPDPNANANALTIPQAIALAEETGANATESTYTTEAYSVSGTVTFIDSTTYGNLYLADAEGNSFYVYGVYINEVNKDNRYDKLTAEQKPVVGDTITVTGVIGQYVSYSGAKTSQMKDSILDLDSMKKADTTVSATVKSMIEEKLLSFTTTSVTADGSVDVAVKGTLYQDVTIEWNSSDTSVASYADGKIAFTRAAEMKEVTITATIKVTGAADKTVEYKVTVAALPGSSAAQQVVFSKTIATLATENEWANNKRESDLNNSGSFALDSVISMSVTGDNTGKYNTANGGEMRLYGSDNSKAGGTLTFTAQSGYKIVSVKLTVVTTVANQSLIYQVDANGDDIETDVANKVVTVGSTDVTFHFVLNSADASGNGKHVKVTAIEIIYEAVNS